MGHQDRFFAKLIHKFSSQRELVREVSRLLELSPDAIYRRLRGTSSLSADELIRLAQHYRVPVNTGDERGISFTYNQAERRIRTPKDFIDQLSARLDTIEKLPDLRLSLANPGLPFFHEMMSPRLFAFKLYLYGSTCWNFPGWRKLKFAPDLIDEQVLEQARAIGAYSYSVPGAELLTMGMLTATLDQIEVLQMTGRFAGEYEAELLLRELEWLVDHLEAMARSGKKFVPGDAPENGADYFPAHNELANNDNVILIESSLGASVYVTFITPNFLETVDESVAHLSREWFRVISERSTSIGADAGKYRDWFFNRLRGQIIAARGRLSALTNIDM